jgi:hypothetical protein
MQGWSFDINHLIMAGYIAAYFFYALTLLTCLFRWNGLSRFLSVTALALNASILCHRRLSPNPPVVMMHETWPFICLI